MSEPNSEHQARLDELARRVEVHRDAIERLAAQVDRYLRDAESRRRRSEPDAGHDPPPPGRLADEPSA